MLNIKTVKRDSAINDSDYEFKYPQIESEGLFIEYINSIIKNDVDSFEHNMKSKSNINFKYEVRCEIVNIHQNKDIVSICMKYLSKSDKYIESYIKSYNFDINLERELDLKDIIDINQRSRNILYAYIKQGVENPYIDIYINDIEYEELDFYIDKNNLILNFSSYELDYMINDIIQIKIPLTRLKNIITNYFNETCKG